MKLAARKNATVDEQRRYQRQHDRDRSPPLRTAFPEVSQLSIELAFADRSGSMHKEPAPSSQSHAFYPPARAFFRFTCPCADCNGEFDLSASVAQVAASSGRASRSATAKLQCSGVRARDRVTGSSCPIELTCRIVAKASS